MKRTLGLAAVGVMLITLTALAADEKDKPKSAKETHESVTKKIIKSLEKMTTVLESAKDEATAKKAKTDLDAVIKDLQVTQAEATKLGDPPPDELKKLDDKFKAEMDAVAKKLFTEATRLKDQAYGKDLLGMIQSKMKPAAPAAPTGQPKTAPAKQ